ncbi:MAG TPA: S41 family peptidase [Pyrinomonadaceae bacterium]|nr:S41 family peptidase [Pyrinomonadaceae bacterium]
MFKFHTPVRGRLWLRRLFLFLIGIVTVLSFTAAGSAQTMSLQRERARGILRVIRSEIEKNYYDANYHGVDINAVFGEADELMKKAESGGQIYGIIARALMQFNDSHLYFAPPSRASKVERGWTMQAIGDKTYISSVKPGSDADKKGLHPGDLVLSVNEMAPTRETLWMIEYLFVLRPQVVTQFILENPKGEARKVDVDAKVTQGRKVTDLTNGEEWLRLQAEEEREARLFRHRYIKIDDVFFWKMPIFDLPQNQVDDMMGKVKGSKALVLDLRGNGGGAEETLLRMIGNLFERDITVGVLKRRKEEKTLVAKSRGDSAYKGDVIILIDNGSGSSSELLARVVQLEKRGVVIGDRSAGAVMRARFSSHSAGLDTVIFYGVSVTDADVIMTDGKSLEKLGVTPDVLLLPTAIDMSLQSDPVLSAAAARAGLTIPAEKAGKIFPVEWRQ